MGLDWVSITRPRGRHVNVTVTATPRLPGQWRVDAQDQLLDFDRRPGRTNFMNLYRNLEQLLDFDGCPGRTSCILNRRPEQLLDFDGCPEPTP